MIWMRSKLKENDWKLDHLGIRGIPGPSGWVLVSRPDSRSDPIGGSEPVSGCENIYWDSLLDFFFKAEFIPIGMAHIL